MRCITQSRPVTADVATAEAAVNTPLLAAHVAKQSAGLAQSGDYFSARVNSIAYDKVMRRCS